MEIMRYRTLAAVACCVGAFTTTLVMAGPREDNAIKARRGYYQMMLWDLDPVEFMLKGTQPWDAAAAKRHAQGMKALADFDIDRLFVPGTSNADAKGQTRALPAIWEQREEFARLNREWRAQAATLLTAADTGREAFNKELVTLGGTCKACHDKFRAKDF